MQLGAQGSSGIISRLIWIAGALHGLAGSAIFFLTLHPLRDALDAHALALVQVTSALQAIQGVALLVLAQTSLRIPAALIALGTLVFAAMIYIIAFLDMAPFPYAVPGGGLIMALGWLWLAFVRPN